MKNLFSHLSNSLNSNLRQISMTIRQCLLPLPTLGAILCSTQLCLAAPSPWNFTGGLNEARDNHTATLLPDGKVLVAGGLNGQGVVGSAEIYDPVAGTWAITGSLHTPRRNHTATLLANGMVLVAGGFNSVPLASAELYDPSTGLWSITGDMVRPRYIASAVLLPDGRVLVASGFSEEGEPPLKSEIYDPISGQWSATGKLNELHVGYYGPPPIPLTLLPDGKVLIAAGGSANGAFIREDNDAEIYDPAHRSWVYTTSLHKARLGHTATLLQNGLVLVAGGNGLEIFASCELYDPISATWTPTGNLVRPHTGHTASLLNDGRVLLAGGGYSYGSGQSADTELFDPNSGSWKKAGAMNNRRTFFTATVLLDGRVLAVGGSAGGVYLNTAELYDPAAN